MGARGSNSCSFWAFPCLNIAIQPSAFAVRFRVYGKAIWGDFSKTAQVSLFRLIA